MTKLRLLLNIGLLLLIICGVYLLTHYAKPIRDVVNSPKALVAGASDIDLDDVGKEQFSQQLANDAQKQVSKTKDTILNVKLGEIVAFIGQGKKIFVDIRSATKEIQSIIK